MLRYPRVIVLAALFGCGPPPFQQTIRTPPSEHDVKREFVLAADLDAAHAAVIAVYARLMLPVDQLETKDGPNFRLINAKTIALTERDKREDYADCGVLWTDTYKSVLKFEKLYFRFVDKLVSSTERPGQARTMAFNLVLLAQGATVVMRIETSFKDAQGRPCTSKGGFEESIYMLTLSELRPRSEEPANPNTTRPAPR